MTSPSEDTDGALERCPVARCVDPLVLTITSCVPLYRHDPPWPGAGRATYDADDAVSDAWSVECLNGHTVWTSLDQIRAENLTRDDDDMLSEDADSAPTFRLDLFLDAYPDRSSTP